MSTTSPMGSLCKIPRELRDSVYAEVLAHSIRPPRAPSDEGDQREEDQGWGTMYYQRHLPRTNAEGLLGCCHQTRQEVLDLINANNDVSCEQSIQYSLDLMIWENSIEPTWLVLPTPPKYVRRVEVTIRIFSHRGPQWGMAGILGQYLLQMLRRFLHYGPSFATDPPGKENTRPLYPLYTKEMTIVLESMQLQLADGEIMEREPWSGAPHKEPEARASRWLHDGISKFAKSGLLFGSIDRLEMWYQGVREIWLIKDKGNRYRIESARRWNPYGWGPILQITQRIVNRGSIEYSEELDCVPPDPAEADEDRVVF